MESTEAIRREVPGFPARVGRQVRVSLGQLGGVARLAWDCLGTIFRLRAPQWRVLYQVMRNQIRFTALDALPLAAFTALLLGGVTLLQAFGSLSGLGAESYLSRLMARLVVRELGPLLVGVIVVGRSGTAIAAEMASMKLGREVDALEALGVDPLGYLVLPRVLGGMVSVFVLVVCFDAVALLGGFAVASLKFPLSLPGFAEAMGAAIGLPELLGTLAKSVAFGAAIPLLCVHVGLRVRHASTEIPQAVTRAAVAALLAVFLLGALLSVVCHG